MYTGSIPTASIYGTWSENMEIWSADDDTLYDLSAVTEITIKLRTPGSQFDELTLTMSNGDITVPSTGIIQWRVEATQMGSLIPQYYQLILILEDGTDTVPVLLGSVVVVD